MNYSPGKKQSKFVFFINFEMSAHILWFCVFKWALLLNEDKSSSAE